MFSFSLHLPPPPESWMGQGQTVLQALHCRTRRHPAVIKTSGPSINLIVVIVRVCWYHVSIYGNPVSCFEGELQVWVWVGRVFLGNIVIHCHHFLRGRKGGRGEGRGKGGRGGEGEEGERGERGKGGRGGEGSDAHGTG